MNHEDLIGPAATLTAALLKPMNGTPGTDPKADSNEAVRAVELFMKVHCALAAKFPRSPDRDQR